jgi:hypothetical protein
MYKNLWLLIYIFFYLINGLIKIDHTDHEAEADVLDEPDVSHHRLLDHGLKHKESFLMFDFIML